MPVQPLAILLIASMCAAQTPTAPMQQTASASSASITVPQGTLVALKLITQIKSKSTHRGDPVRAVVAFPLAIGTRVVIPAGTFVEGVVNNVNTHPPRNSSATVELRFNHMIFANGYTVPLLATNTDAAIQLPPDPRRTTFVLADARDGAPYLGPEFAPQPQTTQQPPSLPSTGPSPGVLAGIGVGSTVGILVLTLALSHHRATHADYILFDSGCQFQMALQEPLILDSTQVAAAADIAK